MKNYFMSTKDEAQKAWENLPLSNNFLFQKFMLNEKMAKKILYEILGVEIERIEYPKCEYPINIRDDSKSIRLDVYIKGDDCVYNIEMQTYSEKYLPKRGRYYQDLIDLDLLEAGGSYKDLGHSFVIFICTFDYYKRDWYKYIFSNRCEDDFNLEFGDDTKKVIVNTKGRIGDVSSDFKDFCDAVNGHFNSTEFSDTIKSEIVNIKSSMKWRREFMTLYQHEQDIKEQSFNEGKDIGLREGKDIGLREGKDIGLREGKNIGLREGKDIGLREGKAVAEEAAIRNMLHADISIEKIIAMGYDQELVLKLSKEN